MRKKQLQQLQPKLLQMIYPIFSKNIRVLFSFRIIYEESRLPYFVPKRKKGKHMRWADQKSERRKTKQKKR